nr:hypothetical protein [Tanacetum cinerariifolium]
MPLGNESRTTNNLEPMTPRCSTVSHTPLYSNSFTTHRDILFIVESGCSKHMMGNLKLLTNFVEKSLDTNNIVIGLPKLKFVKDHLCSSCELGKSKQKSFHTKTIPRSKRRLQLLHMDLCGPMQIESIIGLHAQVITVQTGKDTKFWNKTLHEYFAQEGIQHQTSVARTPGQNDVVERRNHALVEAARTMLSTAKVPLYFWAEEIATSCFTQNRSLVIPRHEKTPYHIINGQKLSISLEKSKKNVIGLRILSTYQSMSVL